MKNNAIIYHYAGCKPEDFEHEVSFDETVFTEKLNEIFKLNIQIDRIEVTFHHDIAQGAEPYSCTVDVVAPSVADNKATTHGKDIASTTRKAIDTALQLFRKYKDKHTH